MNSPANFSTELEVQDKKYLDTYNLILSKITECDPIINEIKGKDVVLLLGNTKAGKSSVSHYIIGNALIGKKASKRKVYNIVAEHADKGPKIGDKSASETTLPSVWTSMTIPELLVDAPGFDDNRGEAQDIANCFYIKKIISNARSVKFLLVCDINDVTGDNINNFINFLQKIHTILPSLKDTLPGVGMIFTKDREGYCVSDIRGILTDIVEDRDLCMKKEVLEYFTSDKHKNMAIFPAPKADGVLADIAVDVINVIEGTQKIAAEMLAKTSVGVSEKSLLFLNYAEKKLLQNEEYSKLLDLILTHYSDRFERCDFRYECRNEVTARCFKDVIMEEKEKLKEVRSDDLDNTRSNTIFNALQRLVANNLTLQRCCNITVGNIQAIYQFVEFISDVTNQPAIKLVKNKFNLLIDRIDSILDVAVLKIQETLNEMTAETYQVKIAALETALQAKEPQYQEQSRQLLQCMAAARLSKEAGNERRDSSSNPSDLERVFTYFKNIF